MLKQIEGSRAMAEAIALCRPEVICAYPITPQTHIVEGLGEMVQTGELKNCEFINVESEFAALSVAIGASAAGARAYTATASQGLLYMAEAVYNASGLGLPIVMTLGNRAIGAPINIWNDHSDAMAMRDSGWMQLFAETNQEAARPAHPGVPPGRGTVDAGDGLRRRLHPDARRRARRHADQATVDALPAALRAACRCSIPTRRSRSAPWSGPDAFTEVRYLQHYKQQLALRLIPQFAADFKAKFGRDSGGLLRTYRAEDAETDRRRHGLGQRHHQGHYRRDARRRRADRPGHALCSFRPFPTTALRAAGARAQACRGDREESRRRHGRPARQQRRPRAAQIAGAPQVHSVIAGLGGRADHARLAASGVRAAPWRSHGRARMFLDLNERIVGKELHHVRKVRRSGPTAENLLRRLGEAPAKAAV